MDIRFYKLHVAGDPWALVDRTGRDAGREPDLGRLGRDLSRSKRGAGCRGLVVLERPDGKLSIRAFDRRGAESEPSPDAALCAARFAFDSGLAGKDGAELSTRSGSIKVDAIDSRNLGVNLGMPSSLSGEPFGEADGERFATSIEVSGRRLDILPLRAAGLAWAIAIASGNPRAALDCFRASGPYEVLALRLLDRSTILAAGRRPDALAAAGAALAAACARGLAEREAAVRFGADAVWTRWDDSGGLYAAASPQYAFSGEYWLPELQESGPA